MSDKCRDCRFMTAKGCRVGVCQDVRDEYGAKGWHSTYRPLQVQHPEPLGSGGVAGWVVDYGTNRSKEFPPTPKGASEADAFIAYLVSIGVECRCRQLKRDLQISQGA